MTTPGMPRRARSVAELYAVIERFQSEESRQRALAFQPRPSDILISPFPKSGTTWVQQIVHGLRTRGDMSFDEITEVTPWLEMAYDMGWDLEAAQPPPRAYKSHLAWHEIPKGARYLIPIRDPQKVLVSFYHFLGDWWFDTETLSITDFAQEFFLTPRGYWQHLASWWEHRSDGNVLLLCYEEMLVDLPRAVRMIAAFIDVAIEDELLELVVRQSSLAFMSAHERQFDDHLINDARSTIMGIPPGGNSSKVNDVRRGQTRQMLPAKIVEELDHIWQEEIGTKFGLPSYEALRKAMHEDTTHARAQ